MTATLSVDGCPRQADARGRACRRGELGGCAGSDRVAAAARPHVDGDLRRAVAGSVDGVDGVRRGRAARQPGERGARLRRRADPQPAPVEAVPHDADVVARAVPAEYDARPGGHELADVRRGGGSLGIGARRRGDGQQRPAAAVARAVDRDHTGDVARPAAETGDRSRGRARARGGLLTEQEQVGGDPHVVRRRRPREGHRRLGRSGDGEALRRRRRRGVSGAPGRAGRADGQGEEREGDQGQGDGKRLGTTRGGRHGQCVGSTP